MDEDLYFSRASRPQDTARGNGLVFFDEQVDPHRGGVPDGWMDRPPGNVLLTQLIDSPGVQLPNPRRVLSPHCLLEPAAHTVSVAREVICEWPREPVPRCVAISRRRRGRSAPQPRASRLRKSGSRTR
jgi:hypothetical protein